MSPKSIKNPTTEDKHRWNLNRLIRKLGDRQNLLRLEDVLDEIDSKKGSGLRVYIMSKPREARELFVWTRMKEVLQKNWNFGESLVFEKFLVRLASRKKPLELAADYPIEYFNDEDG